MILKRESFKWSVWGQLIQELHVFKCVKLSYVLVLANVSQVDE